MSDFLKGRNFVIVPRVTTLERNALTATNGMLVYDTTANAFYKYENGAWSSFGGGGSGTVTSVSALTLGTTGTDLSSTVADSTTTPVITLNVPTASASNRGALSSSDWTTFNSKQDNILKASLSAGNVTLNNTLTATDLTGLSFSVAANSRYAIIGHIRCGSANASGIKWAVNAPAGSTVNKNTFGLTSTATAFRSEIISALATLTTNPFPAANTTQGFVLDLGTVETGANAGTVQIQWATAGNYLITAYKYGTFVFLIKL